MSDEISVPVLPAVWLTSAASALLAVVTYYASVPVIGSLTDELAVVASAGALYLLYRWGQERDQPRQDGGTEEERRKKRRQKARVQESDGF